MVQVDAHNRDPARSNAMARFMLNTVAVVLITLASAAGGVAMAQQNANEASPGGRDRIEAPIGHRQPREQDLPRSVLQDEGKRTEPEIDVDKKLNSICRGC